MFTTKSLFSTQRINPLIPFFLAPLFKISLKSEDWLENLPLFISYLSLVLAGFGFSKIFPKFTQKGLPNKQYTIYAAGLISLFVWIISGISYFKFRLSAHAAMYLVGIAGLTVLKAFSKKSDFHYLTALVQLLRTTMYTYFGFVILTKLWSWEALLLSLAIGISLTAEDLKIGVLDSKSKFQKRFLAKALSISLFLSPMLVSGLVSLNRLPTIYLIVLCTLPLAVKLAKQVDTLNQGNAAVDLNLLGFFPLALSGLIVAAGVLVK